MLTITTTEEARQERTTALLARFRKQEGKDEFAMLKGVLVMDSGMSNRDALSVRLLFDTARIAARCDEILEAERKALLASFEAVGV